MPTIYATSDIHGILPNPDAVPECDILILAGDICPDGTSGYQFSWLNKVFNIWLNQLPVERVIGIGGNHDFVLDILGPERIGQLGLNWDYLLDRRLIIDGLKFYGLPWVPHLKHWAFFLNREDLAARYNAIPKDTDIVISHGPPFGIGDRSNRGNINCGAKCINDMLDRVRPQAFVCGHIHEGYGYYRHEPQHGNSVDVYNVAYLDDWYDTRPIAQPIVQIMLDGKEESPDQQREVHRPVTCDGQPFEPPEGSNARLSDVDDAQTESNDSYDARRGSTLRT